MARQSGKTGHAVRGRPAGELPAADALVLLVDDEPSLLRALGRILTRAGHRVASSPDAAGVEAHLPDPQLAVVLLDLRLGPDDGHRLLERIRCLRPDVEVVVLTGCASVDGAVRCMRAGAFDYLTKPLDEGRVREVVARALERAGSSRRLRLVREPEHPGEPALVGESPAMRRLLRSIEALRHSESHVLIQGETGSGKELAARAVHRASPVADGPFVPVDCGALPESIIESELFGHERGAFTGARGAPGLFRIAEGGTLFLDEVGEIPLAIQAKLLRALQYKEVRPVGSARAVPVRIRVIAATHRDLRQMVAAGRFREDLFYRLHVVRLEVPPLRERREDIPRLVAHFLARRTPAGRHPPELAPGVLPVLLRYPWPGNVRELEHAVEAALARSPQGPITLEDLGLEPVRPAPAPAPSPEQVPLSLEAYERLALERALAEAGGDVRTAARLLGVGRSTLYRKLGRHGLLPAGRGRGSGAGDPVRIG